MALMKMFRSLNKMLRVGTRPYANFLRGNEPGIEPKSANLCQVMHILCDVTAVKLEHAGFSVDLR
jgi:hypothetical protein